MLPQVLQELQALHVDVGGSRIPRIVGSDGKRFGPDTQRLDELEVLPVLGLRLAVECPREAAADVTPAGHRRHVVDVLEHVAGGKRLHHTEGEGRRSDATPRDRQPGQSQVGGGLLEIAPGRPGNAEVLATPDNRLDLVAKDLRRHQTQIGRVDLDVRGGSLGNRRIDVRPLGVSHSKLPVERERHLACLRHQPLQVGVCALPSASG